MTEAERKLATIRSNLGDADGCLLKGLDWFAWSTCGRDASVLTAAETGIADALITKNHAFILTSNIEARRLQDEQPAPGFEILQYPWEAPLKRDMLIADVCGSKNPRLMSDRPQGRELDLPLDLVAAKQVLSPEEIIRYKDLGKAAAAAIRTVMERARPEQTENELAGMASHALLAQGITCALVLVSGQHRGYRHPLPTHAKIGDQAMVVVCARRDGLYANLTRFAFFREPTGADRQLQEAVSSIEAEILGTTRPGNSLDMCYQALARSYERHGYKQEMGLHHQGGTTGYLSRELIARPGSDWVLKINQAVAWNPSLTGTKIEDTFLIGDNNDLICLTEDSSWPMLDICGRRRPDYLVHQ